MQTLKLKEANVRRFIASPQKHILSTPKLSLEKRAAQQEQRVRNYIYKKSNFLGKGFSSRVYKAYKGDNIFKPYAIKIINLAELNYDQRRSLQQELKIHRNLSHPHLVKCYETFKTTSNLYLILEYCQHGTLSDYLKNHKKLDEGSTIQIISQIYQGYLYLTTQKLLHRDLKPQNILRKDNVWKITDFGFACHLQGQTFQDDMNVGTPLYMPIQSLTKDIYSYKSDIFSLGMIVYKMLAGTTPWKCNTQKQLIRLMNNKNIQFPEVKNKYLDEFIRKSLQLTYQKRLSLEELKQLIVKIKQEQSLIQKQNQTKKISSLRVYQSKRSSTTAESITSSRKKRLSSFNSSIKSQKELFIASQKQFEGAQNTLLEQLQSYRIIHHMILNIDSLIPDHTTNPQIYQHGLDANTNIKEVLIVFFYKYVLKNIRILNSIFNVQNGQSNFKHIQSLGINNVDQFMKSNSFINLSKLIKQKSQFYQAQFLQSYIKKSILTIRFINKRFPQLGQNNCTFGIVFYENLLQFIKPLIQGLNDFIIQNLQRAKSSNKSLTKDKILSLIFWLRLYIYILKKQKLIEKTQQEVQNNANKEQLVLKYNEECSISKNQDQITNSIKTNLCMESYVIKTNNRQIIDNQIQQLNELKQKMKIQFLYNFKQTSLQFKYYLQIKKLIPQIFKLHPSN